MSQMEKRVDMRSNPLYPDRIENNAVGVLLALVSVVVAIILLVLIVKNFSYAIHPENVPGYGNQNYPVVTEDDYVEPYQEDEIAMEEFADDTAVDMEEEAVSQDTIDIVDEDTSEYIIADSDSRYLERADLQNLNAEQLRLARNEIYARHGRMFDDQQLQEYFNSKSWYNGTIAPADFSEDMLNDYERENTYIITDYETEMGYR